MSENHIKKVPSAHIERTLWISLTALLLLIIIILLVFAYPDIFHHKYSYVAPGAKEDRPSNYSARLERIYNLILENYVKPVDAGDLYRAAVNGMINFLDDPYAELMEKISALDVSDTLTGEFGGVGLVITKNKLPEDGKEPTAEHALYVVTPIEGTPAYRAGIKAGDYIDKIDSVSTFGLTTDESMQKLRGKPGTSVTLTVRRDNTEFQTKIKRAKIEIETAKYDIIGHIGYLRIIEFTSRLPLRVHEALLHFNEQKIDGLIIDLRSNPGGSLEAALEVADFFLNKNEVIVSTSSQSKQEEIVYSAKSNAIVSPKLPIVVLIDKGSASASEILAGALQDHKRATLIGQDSYGKAKVQQIFPLKQDNSELLKLTVAKYLTPEGKDIDKNGIRPDIVVDMARLQGKEALASWKILHENRLIEKFLSKNPNPSPDDIERFMKEQRKKGVYLKREDFLYLIRMEQIQRITPQPVYDLEFDAGLRKAIEVLNKKK